MKEKEPTPQSCPLNFTQMPWHALPPHKCVQTYACPHTHTPPPSPLPPPTITIILKDFILKWVGSQWSSSFTLSGWAMDKNVRLKYLDSRNRDCSFYSILLGTVFNWDTEGLWDQGRFHVCIADTCKQISEHTPNAFEAVSKTPWCLVGTQTWRTEWSILCTGT